MESVLIIMSTLCVVMYSGGTDCSYEWAEAPKDTVLDVYYAVGGKDMKERQLLAFTDMDNRQVWFAYPIPHHAIMHEIKHVICHLEYERHGVNHPDCKGHFRF